MTYRVGLLGFGYWGKNLARNVEELRDLELAWIGDLHEPALSEAEMRYPRVRRSLDPDEVVEDSDLDLVIVATPLDTHADLVHRALAADKHVLVTKPFVADAEQGAALIELATRKHRMLAVDHTYVYSASVRRMKQLVDEGNLGKPLYCSSVRVNLGTFRGDANVLWDLAPHDLSILSHLLGTDPIAVVATGGLQLGTGVDQFAHLTAYYPDGFIAHLNLSWLAPVKVRLMFFGGTEKMVVYDDLDQSAPVKVYDKSLSMHVEAPAGGGASFAGVVEYRVGDMWAPHVERSEALADELEHVVDCLRTGAEPLTGGVSAVKLTAALQAADRSIREGGSLQVLDERAWSEASFTSDQVR